MQRLAVVTSERAAADHVRAEVLPGLLKEIDVVARHEQTPLVAAAHNLLDLRKDRLQRRPRALQELVGAAQVKPDGESIADLFGPEHVKALRYVRLKDDVPADDVGGGLSARDVVEGEERGALMEFSAGVDRE